MARLPQAERDAFIEKLESLKIDTSQIGNTTTVREIITHTMKILLATQRLGRHFPETDLSKNFSSLSLTSRQNIVNYLKSRKISTGNIGNNTPVRQVVNKLGQARWGEIILGPDKFRD